ncbi:hypothetical protein LBMAG42_11620 [Deltaproteobacteria bacterium]|nr:hypothetical protein LBMAG42_11620 [Deltaproteobacteria bacterium]
MITVGANAPPLFGQPVFGRPFQLDRARARGAVVVAFLGPLSAAASLDNLARLTTIWPRIDAEAGGLVGVTRSPLEAARDFVPRHHVLFPVLVDDTGEAFASWGVGLAKGLDATLLRAQPKLLRRALSVIRNGQPLPEAHDNQLPAAFVVGADGRVRWAWYGRSLADRVDAEAAWSAVHS